MKTFEIIKWIKDILFNVSIQKDRELYFRKGKQVFKIKTDKNGELIENSLVISYI